MGTKVSAATIVLPAALASGDYVPVDDGVLKQKIDLSLLVPPRFAFTDAGAVGAKTLTISPANPGGASHTNYQLSVAAAASGVDEAINIGYNIGSITSTEPSVGFIQEIDYLATARGVATQRTMEIYTQFRGASSGGLATNVPRGYFHAFETNDTSRGGTTKGQLLYGYLSTGYNRTSTPGGGGFTISTDLNEGVAGYAHFDVDGSRLEYLRSCQDVTAITSATAANPCVITVASGHGFNIGAMIQIFKPDANGVFDRDWVSGTTACVGVITATTSTTLTLTGINNASGAQSGITTGYGYQLARPAATLYAPAFQFLAVGTSDSASAGFTMKVAGTVGLTGSVGIATAAFVTGAGREITSSDFIASPVSITTTDATASGRRQMYTAYSSTASTGWSMGFADDATGDNYDNFIWGLGVAQGTDSAFTVLKTAITAILFNTDNTGIVGIGGISPYNRAKLVIAAGTTTHAQIGLASGTAKTTPVVGDITYDGTTFRACTTAGTWNDIASGAATTGAQTATFVATNKPGSGTAGPTGWLPYKAGATTYYIPLFGA